MVRRRVPLVLIWSAILALGGCASTSEVKQRPGVEEAKACLRAVNTNPAAIPGYVIHACTNTGVWMVDQVDPAGAPLAQYDFVNGDYAGPETGFGFVPVDSLGDQTIQAYHDLQKTLNRDLVNPPKQEKPGLLQGIL